MEHIPKRRHGIDGLSHGPASVRPQSSHQAATGQPALLRTAPMHPAQTVRATEGFALASNVSHPSLPQQHSRIQDKPASSVRKLVGYPFAPGLDKRILRLGLISTVLDIRFWAITLVPIVVARLAQLTSLAPAQLVEFTNTFLVARNYVWAIIIVGGFYLGAIVSVLIVALSRQVMTAIKIRRIDHRVSRGYILIRHAVSNILVTSLSWLLDLLLASTIIVSMIGAVYWLTVASATWLAPFRSYAVGLVVLVALLLLGILFVRRKLQRSMLATTQLPLGAIQARSFKLVWHNPSLSAVAFGFAVVELVVATSLIVLIGASFYTYLPALTTIPARLSVWLLALAAIMAIWLGSVLWQSAHWAGFYHIVVLRCKKDQVSDYLVPSGPLKLRVWPAIAAACVVLTVLVAYVAAAFVFQGQVKRVSQQIKATIPSDVGRLVPGID